MEEQRAIVAHVHAESQSLEQAQASAKHEITLLHEYRTRLIADVVTGKLDVRDAAAGLPEEEPVADESLSEPYDPDDAEDSLEDESFPSEEQ
jgi:type I restriction enzyme S subunit